MDGDSRVILLADAMVLIDLGYLGAVSILPQISHTEVLDVVLEERPMSLQFRRLSPQRRETHPHISTQKKEGRRNVPFQTQRGEA